MPGTMRKTISVAIITYNEEANLGRTLASVAWADEIIVVDSGSTDRTAEIAREYGAKFFREDWKGFAGQKNFAVAKSSGDLVLSLDADEEVSTALAAEILGVLGANNSSKRAYTLPRRNHFLGRWIRHGGYYPHRKLRLFSRGACIFKERQVRESMRLIAEDVELDEITLRGDLIHHCYPTLEDYILHMQRYSSLGAEQARLEGKTSATMLAFAGNIIVNPAATFVYNYIFRAGFLDGCEGLLLHIYHSVYISWRYAKAWQGGRFHPH